MGGYSLKIETYLTEVDNDVFGQIEKFNTPELRLEFLLLQVIRLLKKIESKVGK